MKKWAMIVSGCAMLSAVGCLSAAEFQPGATLKDDLQAMADESRKYTGAKYKGSGLPDMMGQDEIRKYTEHVEKRSRPT